MGGGGLRILPHKSWNVYNRDNIKRVRDDEAKHESEKEYKNDRAKYAENQHRLHILRKRAAIKGTLIVDNEDALDAIQQQQPPPSPPPRKKHCTNNRLIERSKNVVVSSSNEGMNKHHVNLFEDTEHDMEDYMYKQLKEKEKKSQEYADLKKVCPDVFFARTVYDVDTGKKRRNPWYIDKMDNNVSVEGRKRIINSDPLMKINEALNQSNNSSWKRRKHRISSQHINDNNNNNEDQEEEEDAQEQQDSKKHAKKKKKKKKKKKNRKHKKHENNLDALRAERLKREAIDREKTSGLFWRRNNK